MKATFRKASVRDLPRLNEIVNDRETARFLNLIPPVTMKSTREFFEHCRKTRSMLYCIIADGKIAGSACLTPRRMDCKQAHVAEFGISIAKEFWGRHIGGKAIDFIVRKGRERGIKRIEFEVVADNLRAMRLYEKKGFRKEGLKKNSLKINGRYHDTVVMARILK